MRVKVCLVGDRGVGKTSLVRRYIAGKFDPGEQGTLGAHLHPIEVDVPLGDRELVKARVALFDFMGEHAMRDNFRDAIFYGAHGGVAVCDMGRRESLYALVDWIQAFTSVAGDAPIAVVLNKADLAQGIAVGLLEMRWLREEFPALQVSLTSALTGQGVEEAFNGIITRAVDGIMGNRHKAQVNRLLRHRILSAVLKRDTQGMSKADVIEAFKSTDPRIVMEELDNLLALDLIVLDECGPTSSATAESVPVTYHFSITPSGRKVALEPEGEDLVIDELA